MKMKKFVIFRLVNIRDRPAMKRRSLSMDIIAGKVLQNLFRFRSSGAPSGDIHSLWIKSPYQCRHEEQLRVVPGFSSLYSYTYRRHAGHQRIDYHLIYIHAVLAL